MSKWRINREYHRTAEKWQKTGDIGYAALEVGRWYGAASFPNNPPTWALEACRALLEKAKVGIEPVLTRTQGGRPHSKDYERIDRVATEHYNGNQQTARDLFRNILESEGIYSEDEIASSVRRLLNYYGPVLQTEDGVVNEHVNRIAQLAARLRRAGRTFGDF